jgi:rRNA-processing protein EBP2
MKRKEKCSDVQRDKPKRILSSQGEVDMSADPVHNDFKREMLFYRQAQAAALEGLARLKSMNIPTKRPDDYFAQMAKTDEHMQKIRSKLVTKQMTEEKLEKVRKLRDLRRFGKKVQTQVNLKRAADKKEMLDEVKKFRKGHTDTINFLEDGGGSGGGKNKKGGVKTG